MRSLNTYIKEAVENIIKLTDVKVIYAVKPDNVTVAVPKNYSESDMQIYLDDKCLNYLPGSSDESKKILGNNIDEINDAYFEYKTFKASDEPAYTVTLAWDNKYDANNSEDTFTYYTLEELKYIIDFAEFNLKNVEDIEKELKEIFEVFNSNESNEYPIEIELEKITYGE